MITGIKPINNKAKQALRAHVENYFQEVFYESTSALLDYKNQLSRSAIKTVSCDQNGSRELSKRFHFDDKLTGASYCFGRFLQPDAADISVVFNENSLEDRTNRHLILKYNEPFTFKGLLGLELTGMYNNMLAPSMDLQLQFIGGCSSENYGFSKIKNVTLMELITWNVEGLEDMQAAQVVKKVFECLNQSLTPSQICSEINLLTNTLKNDKQHEFKAIGL